VGGIGDAVKVIVGAAVRVCTSEVIARLGVGVTGEGTGADKDARHAEAVNTVNNASKMGVLVLFMAWPNSKPGILDAAQTITGC
jgi:hypothetical protein